MTWLAWCTRTLPLGILLALLAGFFAPVVRADGPVLTASFGIAGHYRPGAWCPVTVTVHNPSSDTIDGQIQVLSVDSSSANTPSRSRFGAVSSESVLFAHPISLTGGTTSAQTIQVYVRGIDPSRSEIAVQLVEGRERGDGRVLARIDTQDQNTSASITGTPVTDSEPLLVGFGGDPGAFTFLSGHKWGLEHSSSGLVTSTSQGTPSYGAPFGLSQPNGSPTTQVAEAVTAADLPDRAAGYGGIDVFLLRSDAPVEALTEAQSGALKGWVAGGGHLIVCGGADRTHFASSFYEGLLPAAWAGNTLTAKRLPGVRVLETLPDGSPSVVSGPYGGGNVTLTAADPAAITGTLTAVQTDYWQMLLTGAKTSSLLAHVAAREENNSTIYYYNGGQQQLSQIVMRGPSLDAPGTLVIGLFLLVYLIVLVPANYLILKRLDRKEMAWVTIPVLVLIFALGTFAVGYAAKGSALFVNRASLVETTAGQCEAGIYSEIGLFSPRRSSYDLTVPGANVLTALPNPGFQFGYSGGSNEEQSYGQMHFVQTPEGAALPSMAYNMWAMRAFDVQSTTDLGGEVDTNFVGLTGIVTNHMPYALSDCAVLWNNQWLPVGNLAPNASQTVTLPGPTRNTQTSEGLPPLPVSEQSDPRDTHIEIHLRMRAALAEYIRSLGQQQDNGYYGSQAPRSFGMAPHEALLIGWSNDPSLAGPSPRVDGHRVTENDVSLVIVHLPLTPSKVGH